MALVLWKTVHNYLLAIHIITPQLCIVRIWKNCQMATSLETVQAIRVLHCMNVEQDT